MVLLYCSTRKVQKLLSYHYYTFILVLCAILKILSSRKRFFEMNPRTVKTSHLGIKKNQDRTPIQSNSSKVRRTITTTVLNGTQPCASWTSERKGSLVCVCVCVRIYIYIYMTNDMTTRGWLLLSYLFLWVMLSSQRSPVVVAWTTTITTTHLYHPRWHRECSIQPAVCPAYIQTNCRATAWPCP